MRYDKLINEPIILNNNRVKRAYIGGMLLDQWQGIEPAVDGNFPEEFLISTVEVTNANKEPGEGLSKTRLNDGSIVSLKEIVESNPEGFLGEKYYKVCNNDLGVLARVGDSVVRLVIQAHPDKECANKYLGFPNGKTEAWYIIKCREVGNDKPHLYAGFKPGLTREKWKELFEKQDIQGMLDAMHKIYIKEGDVIIVDAGMPHAMGAGSLFLEVHEPCDYTLRLEKNYLPGRTFTEEEIHYGIGYEKLFDCFHYDNYTEDEILKKTVIQPNLVKETDCAREYDLLTYEHTDRFAMKKIETTGEYCLEPFDGHRIAIITKGTGTLLFNGGSKTVRPGQGVFLPAGLKELEIIGGSGGLEVIVGYPPKV